MRTIKQTLSPLVLFLFAAIVSTNSYSTTVVLNGGFEDGALEPWYQGVGSLDYAHDEFWNVSSTRAHSGAYSVTNVGNNELRQDITPVSASLISEVSFYLLIESMTADAAVQLHYDDGSTSQVLVSVGDTDIWQRMNITASLDPDKDLAGISFFGIRSSDPGGIRIYLDDINIIATPLPPSLFLFISAVLPFFYMLIQRKK